MRSARPASTSTAPPLRLTRATGGASASFKRAAELFTGTVGQGSHFETLNLRIGTVWGPLGDPDSPFLSIPRLINAAAHGEAPDLVPPRPARFAEDGGDRCYVKDCARAIALLLTSPTLRHDTNKRLQRTSGLQPRVCRRDQHGASRRARRAPGWSLARRSRTRPVPGHQPAHSATGFQPRFGVQDGVADYIRWLRDGNDR
jgi:UDP-glucose 4-epimerase